MLIELQSILNHGVSQMWSKFVISEVQIKKLKKNNPQT